MSQNRGVENQKRSVLIVASGTGGHVFPALAIAKALIAQGTPVVWVGTPAGFEAEIVKKEGIDYRAISVTGLRGKGLKGAVGAPFKILKAIAQSVRIISELNPCLMLAMGGYVSGPAGVAAWLKKVRLIVHEQNAIPGLTNQWLARLSTVVFSGFPNRLNQHKDFRCVGNPLREKLLASAKSLQPPGETLNDAGSMAQKSAKQVRRLRLLVIGGSLGARTLNQWIPTAISEIAKDKQPEIWHQTGEKWLLETQSSYQNLGVNAKVTSFIEAMEEAYQWCDLIICRSGAMTCSEVSAMALPAIFVPYPYAVDDHQKANAESLVSVGAAQILIEKESKPDQVKDLILHLIQNPEKLDRMRRAAWGQRQLDAVTSIVDYIEAYFESESA